MIQQHLRKAVSNLKLMQAGITPDLVGVHPFSAGGTMVFKFNGASETTTIIIGTFTSLIFLQYIGNQIENIIKDISQKMSKKS